MSEGTVTVVSYNRPLTRGACEDLREYDIVNERSVNEHGRWTVVELGREPPETVLEKHELRVEREPDAVFLTDTGDRVEIFKEVGEVTVAGIDQSISPKDAIEHAKSHDWQRIEP